MENEDKYDIRADGMGGGHNGEYYYKCTKCGASDWIASYGHLHELNFYNTTCTPNIPRIEVVQKEAYDLLLEQHTELKKSKHTYIEMLEKRHREELNKKDTEIKALKEEINTLHYTVKGACAEHLNLRIELSPTLTASASEIDLVRYVTERANKQMAHAVEKQLGDRYELNKAYDRALKHIYYLENHMAANGVGFTRFTVPININYR